MITYTSATKKIAEEAFQAALLGDLDKVKQLAGHTFHLETCDEKGNSLLHYEVKILSWCVSLQKREGWI